MEKAKKHLGRKIVFGTLTLLVVAALVAAPFVLEQRSKSGGAHASILSDTARFDSITKTLSGTGTLTEETAVKVTVPEGVEITEYYVKNGDTVKEGDAVARVDKTSVMRAISEVNDTLSELGSQINDAAGNQAEEIISAVAAGRIKAVYARTGDSVRDVITQYGALAVLSLDGTMAVEIDAHGLSLGQSVTVTLSDGSTVPGTVRSLADGITVVTIDDRYGAIDEPVSVRDNNGNALGEGTLFVHSPWKVISYTGTVSAVWAAEGQNVWNGSNLLRLTGTEDTGEYELLIAQRQEYEDVLYQLFLLYQDGVVKAPCDGCVSGVDDALLKQLSGAGGFGVSLLAANTPNGDDATSYHNRVGVITAVNEDGSVSAGIQLFDTEITDYADLGGLNLDTGLMTGEVNNFYPGTIYVHSDEGWGTLGGVSRGDLYVFAFDADLAWMIYVGHVDLPEPEPAQQQMPASSGAPEQGQSGMPSMQGGAAMGGTFPAAGQSAEEETIASPVGTTILSVTPQDTVSVTITVDELDILSVKMGQEVQVTVDALPGQSFAGDITSIDTTATNDGGNTKYAVEITLARTEKMLGGMNASAKITLLTKEDILTVPTQALSEGESETVVYTAYDASSETLLAPVRVETGLSDGLHTEITSGLSEGETIWYAYYDTLPE